jgi:putative membrane protein
MMWNGWGFDGWGTGFGMLFMLLFWGLVVFGAAALIRWLLQQSDPGRRRSTGGSAALEILRERYARGEIGREEYERMKRDLEA